MPADLRFMETTLPFQRVHLKQISDNRHFSQIVLPQNLPFINQNELL
jgi:hypothetical protein